MSTKVFIIALPSMRDMVEEIGSLIEEAFDKPKAKRCEPKRFEEPCDLTPRHMRVNEPCGNTQPWGIGGTPANEDLRFGYGLEVDEPMYHQFDDDKDFLEARQAFDDFVDAGEHCRELGLEKTNTRPITKCNAIRKPIGCPPPMNRELLGESQFPWWETGIDWNY